MPKFRNDVSLESEDAAIEGVGGPARGLVGTSTSNYGIRGHSEQSAGIRGSSRLGPGLEGTAEVSHGVIGITGQAPAGTTTPSFGADSAAGVYGAHRDTGIGVLGHADRGIAVWGVGAIAGRFDGNVEISRNLVVGEQVTANGGMVVHGDLEADRVMGSGHDLGYMVKILREDVDQLLGRR